MTNRKGFTLIELLVVVLIIGILAAMALPQYFKAVERSRMSEAETLLANIAQAQQRKYLQINKFAKAYTGLDVAPKGASGSSFYTKGDATGNGFLITLAQSNEGVWGSGTGTDRVAAATTTPAAVGYAQAHRQSGSTLQYAYDLYRYYGGEGTTCIGTNDNGAALCADFCGIDYLAKDNACCNVLHSEKWCYTPAAAGSAS